MSFGNGVTEQREDADGCRKIAAGGFCLMILLIITIIDRRIYLNLSNSIESAAGLNALKPAAHGGYLIIIIIIMNIYAHTSP